MTTTEPDAAPARQTSAAPMTITEHDDGAAFLACAGPQLLRQEALGGLLYGIVDRVGRLADHEAPVRPLLVTVGDPGAPCLLAAMTPPHRLIVHADRDDGGDGGDGAALQALAAHLRAAGRDLPGVLGPGPLAEAFAAVWSAGTGVRVQAGMGMTVYQLRAVRHHGDAPGRCRPAGQADLPLLSAWSEAFLRDVFGRPPSDGERRAVPSRLAQGAFHLWEDGGVPVSLAATTRPTPTGIAINYVYTPTAHRGRGYATACVAALCQQLLDGGRAFVTLFADLANPTSNGLYRRVGFAPVGVFQEIDFVAA